MIVRILIIILTSFAISFTIQLSFVFYWPVILGGLLIAEILDLLRFQKNLEKSVWQFFRSIRNGDHSFEFKSNSNRKLIKQIHLEMNRVNTLLKELKIEQAARERYYQILLEQVSSGIITINQKGFVELTNKSVLKILQLPVLNHVDQLERIHLKLYRHLQSLKPRERIVIKFEYKQAHREISVSTQEIKIRDQYLFVVILQDIRNELDQKELDSWIKLIRIQAHEIRNSLAPITSVADALINSTDIDETRKGLQIIKERSAYLQKFVESYRSLTHLPNPVVSIFDVCSLLDRVKILLSSQANFQKVDLQTHETCANTTIKADPNQITQVLLNILQNSYEALLDVPNACIQITINNKEEMLSMSFTDNGPGIRIENPDEIFVPFFTTKPNGTGIGLSLSKQIIRKHGGQIIASNHEKGGADFTIVLPGVVHCTKEP